MPYLDLSDAILNPDLAHRFRVLRRTDRVQDDGRTQIDVEHSFIDVVGVVTMASPDDLQRLPEDQRMGRHLQIVTRFALRGPSPGHQPDLIEWGGDQFVVKWFDPYPQFGSGFYSAVVGSIEAIDQPV
jgi:hypothetical protein